MIAILYDESTGELIQGEVKGLYPNYENGIVKSFQIKSESPHIINAALRFCGEAQIYCDVPKSIILSDELMLAIAMYNLPIQLREARDKLDALNKQIDEKTGKLSSIAKCLDEIGNMLPWRRYEHDIDE